MSGKSASWAWLSRRRASAGSEVLMQRLYAKLDQRYARADLDRLQPRATSPSRHVPPHVMLGPEADVDPSVKLWAKAGAAITIGAKAKIYRGGELLGPVSIGDRTFVNRDAYVRPQTSVGADCSIGPFVRFLTDTHELGPAHHRAGTNVIRPVHVEDGCWLGAAVVVLPGVTIGAGSVVAAGAVVASDVPPNSLVAGVPARLLRQLD